MGPSANLNLVKHLPCGTPRNHWSVGSRAKLLYITEMERGLFGILEGQFQHHCWPWSLWSWMGIFINLDDLRHQPRLQMQRWQLTWVTHLLLCWFQPSTSPTGPDTDLVSVPQKSALMTKLLHSYFRIKCTVELTFDWLSHVWFTTLKPDGFSMRVLVLGQWWLWQCEMALPI